MAKKVVQEEKPKGPMEVQIHRGNVEVVQTQLLNLINSRLASIEALLREKLANG